MEAFQFYLWLFPLMAAIFGLIIGSFLNVVIYRLPLMMEREWRRDCAESFPEYHIEPPTDVFNLSLPASTCPHCQTRLKVKDNIPLISWLMLRGKCRYCSQPIGIRYPLVELLSALTCASVAWQFGPTPYALALIAFTLVLIALTGIDFATLLLPDQITLPLIWAGISLALVGISPISLQDAVIGAISGYLCLWTVYWLFKLLTGKEGMGYGDFKLLAALGAWLGWQALPFVVLLSSVVGLVFGLIQLRLQKQGIDKAFPFGPYLAIAGWVIMMWDTPFMAWYFQHYLGY
ncbi:A24 family peptidase [Vibrio sp. AK197]